MLMLVAGCAVLIVVATIGMLVDDRTLGGAPIWAKPLKFGISGAVYGLTWAWLCSLIDHRQRTVRRASAVVAILIGVELVIIAGQALRGRRSHFNFESLFDAILYEIMAISIAVVWSGALVLTLLVVRSNIEDRARKLTVALGAVLSLVGIGLGFLMTLPTGPQVDSVLNGDSFHTLGAHAVGAPDGAPGLPFLGWSTTGGDLRIPHFVGMHALQALLLWNFVLGLAPRLAAVRPALVRIGAAGFAGLLALVTWQAYRGQPLLRPDGLTLAVLAVLVAAMLTAAVVVFRRRTPPATSSPPVAAEELEAAI